ncbi:MAG: hypothetical protein WC447_01550 [Candidatus Paceibacterota bacterium]|jgi:hypothetical protein
MKYKICSQKLRDGRWKPAYLPPIKQVGTESLEFSEPTEIDKHFQTKEDADSCALLHLTKKGIKNEEIEYN